MDTDNIDRPCPTGIREAAPWLTVILVILMATLVGNTASAERKVLQNDSFDGSGTFTQLPAFAEQEYAAASFSADSADHPFRIEKVQALVLAPPPLTDGTIAMVSVTVWQENGNAVPGTVIHTSTYGFQVESSSTAFNELDLSCENIVIDSGPIRVGIRWEYVGDPIGIAPDLDGIQPQINSVYSPALLGWWWAEDLMVSGDWIIRLEIETDIAGSIYSDGFERGDASCWVAP
jgi:hypothetical protein